MFLVAENPTAIGWTHHLQVQATAVQKFARCLLPQNLFDRETHLYFPFAQNHTFSLKTGPIVSAANIGRKGEVPVSQGFQAHNGTLRHVCLLYPRKRTCAAHAPMSAMGQKRTSTSFNHFVSTCQHGRWDR